MLPVVVVMGDETLRTRCVGQVAWKACESGRFTWVVRPRRLCVSEALDVGVARALCVFVFVLCFLHVLEGLGEEIESLRCRGLSVVLGW
jgi:hypothetical protein